MADVTANRKLEAQGLALEMSQLQLNVQSQQYRIAQAQDEATRINANIIATQVSIEALAERINALQAE